MNTRKLPTIPLKDLNCLHCKLFLTECKGEILNPATGKNTNQKNIIVSKFGKITKEGENETTLPER